MTAAPKGIHLDLTPKGEEFVDTVYKQKHVIMAGGWGSAKTSALVYAAYKCAFRWLPGQKGIAAAPTYNQLESGFLTLWADFVNEAYYSIKWGRTPHIECHAGKRKKSIIYLASGQYPKRIESKNVSWALGDEVQDMGEFWDRVCGRVRDKRADILRTFGVGLTEQGYMEELVGRPGVTWIRCKTSDNPHLHPSYEPNLRARLSARQCKIYLDGEMAPSEGAVYTSFYSSIHGGSPVPIDHSLPILIGQDFNYSMALAPMATVFLQWVPSCILHDAPRCWHGVGELIEHNTTLQHAPAVAAYVNQLGYDHRDPKRVLFIPDATGIAGQHARGESDIGIFLQHGFRLAGPALEALKKRLGQPTEGSGANPFVRDRDNAVLSAIENGEGLRRFWLDKEKCKKTIAALAGLEYKGRKDSIHDHPTAALGYPIEHFDPVRTKMAATKRVVIGNQPPPRKGVRGIA